MAPTVSLTRHVNIDIQVTTIPFGARENQVVGRSMQEPARIGRCGKCDNRLRGGSMKIAMFVSVAIGRRGRPFVLRWALDADILWEGRCWQNYRSRYLHPKTPTPRSNESQAASFSGLTDTEAWPKAAFWQWYRRLSNFYPLVRNLATLCSYCSTLYFGTPNAP